MVATGDGGGTGCGIDIFRVGSVGGEGGMEREWEGREGRMEGEGREGMEREGGMGTRGEGG